MKNENNIFGRLERLPVTSVHWKLWLMHEICWIFGSVGLGTTTFVLTNIAEEYNMTATVKGLVATVTYLGMLLGATTAGMLSDRFGRKRMLIMSIALWGLASLGLGLTDNYTTFWILRFILGVGMGAHFPQSQSMLAELFPAKSRGISLCLVEGGYPLACILAGLIGWSLQMVFTWRAVFIAQGCLGLCVFLVIYGIPESARFYEMKGEIDKAKAIIAALETKVQQKIGHELPPIPDPIAEVQDTSGKSKFAQLFEGEQARRTLTMWILWFCGLFGHYGLNTWFSDLLVGNGFSVVKSNGFVILMYLPAIPGYLIATYLVERVGRKKMIFAYMILAAGFAYLYGGANSMITLVIWGGLFQMFNFGIWSLIYTYASEVFPTRIRSTGCGTTSSAGRLAALIAPTLFGVIMGAGASQIYIFIIAAVVFIIGAFTTLIFGTETKGKTVEEITESALENKN